MRTYLPLTACVACKRQVLAATERGHWGGTSLDGPSGEARDAARSTKTAFRPSLKGAKPANQARRDRPVSIKWGKASLASSPVQLVEAIDRDQQCCHQPDSASRFCTHAHVPQKSPANFTCNLGTCLGFASMLSRSLFPSLDLDSRRYSFLRQVLPSSTSSSQAGPLSLSFPSSV